MAAFVTSLVVAGGDRGAVPGRFAAPGRVGRGVRDRRLGADGERVRLPQHDPPGVGHRRGLEPLPVLGRRDRTRGVMVALLEPLANLLGQSPPPLGGWGVALGVIPAVLLADAMFKRVRRAATPAGDPEPMIDGRPDHDHGNGPGTDERRGRGSTRNRRIERIPPASRRSWAWRLGTHLVEPMSGLLILAAAVEGFAPRERLEAARSSRSWH